MDWFKHDSNANLDEKLQEVLLDYGLEGYGLYWYCIELIVNRITLNNITFELKHDARIIARNTGSTVQKVEEMMKRFVDVGLFEAANGSITCLKVAKRLMTSATSNPQMRNLIQTIKKTHEKPYDTSLNPIEQSPSCRRHDDIMPDKIRLDKTRLDNTKNTSSNSNEFELFWKAYPKKEGKQPALTAWLKAEPPIAEVLKALEWQKETEKWKKGFVYNPTTYINQAHWKDEPIVDGRKNDLDWFLGGNQPQRIEKDISNGRE